MFHLLLSVAATTVQQDIISNITKRFDYKQTFKHPFFGSVNETTIPYFVAVGDVLASTEYLRLTPSIPEKSGSLMCSSPNPHSEWSVEFTFQVYGRGVIGGKGLVFWYTKDVATTEHDFFGRSASFQGLAVVIDFSDTQDNRYNPLVYGLTNDGSKGKEAFKNYYNNQVNIGSCYKEVRNTPHAVHARISYVSSKLVVEFDLQKKGADYKTCFIASDISLPSGYHFGLSASTTNTAVDDHDILSFETYQLHPPAAHHKLRPHEKEHLDKGDEFHMKKEYKEEIEKVHKQVDEKKKHEDILKPDDTINANVIRRLEENQFHIIEGLNQIQLVLDSNAPQKKDGGESTNVAHSLSRILSQLEVLESEIKTLKGISKDIQETASLLKKLDFKVQSAHSMVQETYSLHHESKNSHGIVYNALYMFAVLAGVAFILFSYSVYLRSRDLKSKKFI